jgi:pyruvate dehydrogenase E2 component (dihydrolipoamide acetyltransferase)
MPYVFNLPDIGEGIAEAEVINWLVAVGDVVELDQAIAVVETDKAAVEMPSPTKGTVLQLGAEAGDMIQVGDLLIIIEDGKDSGPAPARVERAESAPKQEVAAAEPRASTAPPTPSTKTRPTATPATRRLARELDVVLSGLVGSGPGGRISDDDVRTAANGGSARGTGSGVLEPTPVPAGGATTSPRPIRPRLQLGEVPVDERIPVRGIRRKTAEAMTRAAKEIPHTVAFHDAEFDELLALRKKLQPRATALGINLTLTPFLVKAVALALVEHPMVNSSFDAEAGEIIVRARRNIGVAANTPDGLVIPVIKDADYKPLFAIAREVEELANAARLRQVALADLQEGTFTISNHGPLGGTYGTPIIKPPEAGIMGFGRGSPQAVVRDGQIVIRTMLPMSFSADHRIVDGDQVLGFTLRVKALLEEPVLLLADEG